MESNPHCQSRRSIVGRLVAAALLAYAALPCAAADADHFFDSGGVRLRYVFRGAGEPVVLIHGLGSNVDDGWIKTGVMDGLADRFQVIALDLRGHGKSEKPHDPKAYGSVMAEDVLRLMNLMSIRRAHLVGYSLGARIALLIVGAHPERVRGAVIGGAGWANDERREARRRVAEQTAQSLEEGKGIEPLIRSLTPPSVTVTQERMEPFVRAFLARNDPLAIAAVARGTVALFPSEGNIRRCDTPLLALAGELDPNGAEAEALSRVAKNVRVVIIPGANHADAVRHPEFLQSTKAFLEMHAGR